MAKYRLLKIPVTASEHASIKAAAERDGRIMYAYIRARLGLSFVPDGANIPDRPPIGPVNGQLNGHVWSADELAARKKERDAKWEARRVREKGRALEDGYPWDEKGGYATDPSGKRITLAADGSWEYLDI
ncbi:MAG TPA: hypothetical protein VER98_18595 [Terriglobia bacterium]|nr:hypothetical protein [Terriglobia bacterium]